MLRCNWKRTDIVREWLVNQSTRFRKAGWPSNLPRRHAAWLKLIAHRADGVGNQRADLRHLHWRMDRQEKAAPGCPGAAVLSRLDRLLDRQFEAVGKDDIRGRATLDLDVIDVPALAPDRGIAADAEAELGGVSGER